ncbi:unnamed protein product [Didymodactylos carnosus]|uniref:Non-lysosomal glucosylceramidase n=1 Tax=Didymodactylos carnosus TaxID=1234261 RepID=A0A813W5T4_9BILA|nr:unnamed protein product [Didymodactylos carnosus]CAF0901048.1 unnamed protein product [Didymodactylos carnosus]CAF3636167.1 unnamed protein product [Didymodactylos carnosus]CAF3681677.1 unnamed protein product [Didymodactylos carnosus]
MARTENQEWPILKHYDKDHLFNIALPLGGIGTGCVSLGGRGELRDWEIMNKPAKKFSTVTTGNDAPFFAIFVQPQDGQSITKALIGPIDEVEHMHMAGRPVNHHGLPRFGNASFDAAYPFGQVNLSDDNMPILVKIKGYNPLIPGNDDLSGIPIAVLYYEVTNTSDKLLDVAVCGTMRNFVGNDGSKYNTGGDGDIYPYGSKSNTNVFKQQDELQGIYMYSDNVDKNDAAWGTMALSTNCTTGTVSYRTSSSSNDWNHAVLDFWDDFSAGGILHEKDKLIDDDPMASLAIKQTISAGQTVCFPFYITWNFPNRYAWCATIVGNYYSTQYSDAWDVVLKTHPLLSELEELTLQFVNTFLASDYPGVIKEAALFNLTTLRSQTVFRLPDGHMMGWEGTFDVVGSCFGSCTHVWNYEQATAFLFGDLARSMRDVELNYATMPNGEMKFRVSLPLTAPQTWSGPATDGQMGCVMKMYRDWQLSGDNDFLQQNWQQLKKVLSFAWLPGSWDADQDGVMEGSQPNTMDVNYFGPNPQCNFWYLGALKAATLMATFVKDKDFANKCNNLYEQGSKYMDDSLFNGEYYEQKIIDPKSGKYLKIDDPNVPDYQLGNGCLVDQLVGQMFSHICGLGYLADTHNIQKTLQSIMKYNYLDNFQNHFNNMRSFVLGNESGLLMASWPKGRLKVPFPYFSESMTGFEYTAATGMIYEGQIENGLKCIQSIRNRFDGRKRTPFEEPECGHHYARSMTSWAAVLAWSGFSYSGVEKSMTFADKIGYYFWSNGYAWGSCTILRNKACLTVLYGEIELSQFCIKGRPIKTFEIKKISKNMSETFVF